MQIVLSPSKTIDQTTISTNLEFSVPRYINKSEVLVKKLKQLNIISLQKLMNISPKLAQLTFDRYQFWNIKHNLSNSKQALLSFKGDVYTGLDAKSLSNSDLNYAQEHLIIMSGLYGTLKPLDLIQPYRLEIATKFEISNSKNLYAFWKECITNDINTSFKNSNNQVLVNLASNEYFKSIDLKKTNCEIITPVFKDISNGKYKIISVYAKMARGLMTRYIIKNQIKKTEELKLFNEIGYIFSQNLSSYNIFIFTRG